MCSLIALPVAVLALSPFTCTLGTLGFGMEYCHMVELAHPLVPMLLYCGACSRHKQCDLPHVAPHAVPYGGNGIAFLSFLCTVQQLPLFSLWARFSFSSCSLAG
ncbi:hypothetical protein PoB_006697200 [Plakobranchus ocellatus]|uniref:Secreted protein n=1 Tax=Plakobranchus ocellatus TaxID=259542 RepID=A0AAV4D8I9_9GAST|nr:hypothetical protein PoB_006697200 [Plakobranchus ocellatus]